MIETTDKEHKVSDEWEEKVQKTAFKIGRQNDKKFIEWMRSKEGLGYLFDYYLWNHCYAITIKLSQNFDWFWVISGGERLGKTTMGSQVCAVISPTFKKENICYTIRDIIMQSRNSQKGDSILIDEGALVLFAKDSQSEGNKKLEKLFTTFGMKNLNIVICIPNFFLLSTYIRDHRVKTLIAITDRGKYHGFVRDAITKISKEGYAKKQVIGVRVPDGTTWRGYFNNQFPVINDLNLDEYEKWKEKNINDMMDVMVTEKEEKKGDEDVIDGIKYKTLKQLSKEVSISSDTLKVKYKQGLFKGFATQNRILVDVESFKEWINANSIQKTH